MGRDGSVSQRSGERIAGTEVGSSGHCVAVETGDAEPQSQNAFGLRTTHVGDTDLQALPLFGEQRIRVESQYVVYEVESSFLLVQCVQYGISERSLLLAQPRGLR